MKNFIASAAAVTGLAAIVGGLILVAMGISYLITTGLTALVLWLLPQVASGTSVAIWAIDANVWLVGLLVWIVLAVFGSVFKSNK